MFQVRLERDVSKTNFLSFEEYTINLHMKKIYIRGNKDVHSKRSHAIKGFLCFYKVLILTILTLIIIFLKHLKIALWTSGQYGGISKYTLPP